jgi:hypothetical protein
MHPSIPDSQHALGRGFYSGENIRAIGFSTAFQRLLPSALGGYIAGGMYMDLQVCTGGPSTDG